MTPTYNSYCEVNGRSFCPHVILDGYHNEWYWEGTFGEFDARAFYEGTTQMKCTFRYIENGAFWWKAHYNRKGQEQFFFNSRGQLRIENKQFNFITKKVKTHYLAKEYDIHVQKGKFISFRRRV